MILIECTKCGSNELFEEVGYVVCAYCRLRFVRQPGDVPTTETVITLDHDIENLLERCRNDLSSRRRLANLILDIDPTNVEAKRFLQ